MGRTALVVAGLAGVVAASGCDVVRYNTLEDGFVRPDVVTEIQVDGGGSGDIVVRGDDTITGIDVRRKVRYRTGEAPAESARISGGTLTLNLDCGHNCSVSYEVRLPKGAAVRGSTNSGDMRLSGVGLVDVQVDSGDITVESATGSVRARSDSGDITLTTIGGDAIAHASSGDVTAKGLGGSTNEITANSGDVTIDYAGTGSLVAEANSGDVTITLPAGQCAVTADADSGNAHVNVPTSATGTCKVTATADSGDVTVNAG